MQMDDARKVASSRQVCVEFELGCAKDRRYKLKMQAGKRFDVESWKVKLEGEDAS